jgi:hypothetical protein
MPLQWSRWEKGNKAQVWHSSWINGTAPTDLAPSLYVKTKRKNISVLKALSNNAWVAHISPLGNGTEIQEYVALWEMINSIVRDEEADDQIIYGGGPQMENIQRAAHIAFSSRAGSKKGNHSYLACKSRTKMQDFCMDPTSTEDTHNKQS